MTHVHTRRRATAPPLHARGGKMSRRIGFLLHSAPIVALAGILIAAYAAPARAVPAFVRQTNMSCNQCHTAHGGPVPNFTMTGKKFRSTGYRIVDVREPMESGVEGDKGERLRLPLLDYMSFRLQSVLTSVSRDAATGYWSEATTNPTTRLAIFWVGPIGDHLGIWNEWYFHTLGSQDEEWSLDLASWDEFDIRYTFNPKNPRYQIGMGLTNMPVYDLMGFGPFPVFAGPTQSQRGEIQGLAHPNYGTAFVYGWMFDRWIWLAGGNTGDTNVGWDYSNFIWQLGYAALNTNADELWFHLVGRSGTDVMPIVTQNYVKDGGRDWSYRDGVSGITATRPADAGPYLAKDIDQANTIEGEIRWSRQDWGPHSFESVVRVGWSTEDYKDGAKTDLSTVGVDIVYGWKHTYYAMPFFNTMAVYDFTDRLGQKYSIDHTPQYGVNLGFKPTENFLVNLQVLNFQYLHLDKASSDKGVALSFYIDFLL
jgi:hypothetical protein